MRPSSNIARVLVVCGVMAGPLLIAEPRLTPVTHQEVWQAVAAELRERGMAEADLPQMDDLNLPVALPALSGRSLRVVSACWDASSGRVRVRLQCGEAGECLPFFVYVYLRDSGKDAQVASCQLCWSLPLRKTAPKPLVRAGDRATAVFVAARLRMSTRVVCLDRGREGDVIRVRSLEGHIFRARVSGPRLLEALPQ